jgi:hypothetical protein
MSEFKSAELEQWQYRDPSKVVERLEAQRCQGCKFEKKEKVFEIRVMICEKGRTHGRKCKHFVPTTTAPAREAEDATAA